VTTGNDYAVIRFTTKTPGANDSNFSCGIRLLYLIVDFVCVQTGESKMSDDHLDFQLKAWEFNPECNGVRLLKGSDGRDVIQVRVDLGILQLETAGRPDGTKPNGFPTLLDSLLYDESELPDFELDEKTCMEIDREFVQFYHRRVAWLRLHRYHRAVQDADHTLALMDFCQDHSPCEEWTLQHEQHRAFVLFHRSQAAASAAIEEQSPSAALAAIDEGLALICDNFEDMGWEDQFDSDELVQRLQHFKESLVSEYSIEKSLREKLAEAVELEQYELAARLRDELTREASSN
jgi:UvrB/uvrC motif